MLPWGMLESTSYKSEQKLWSVGNNWHTLGLVQELPNRPIPKCVH